MSTLRELLAKRSSLKAEYRRLEAGIPDDLEKEQQIAAHMGAIYVQMEMIDRQIACQKAKNKKDCLAIAMGPLRRATRREMEHLANALVAAIGGKPAKH